MRIFHLTFTASWLLTAGLALAQMPGAAEQAKARWKDGAAALARGDAEGARTAFKQAYDLFPDPELAQGLGEIEFRTGHFADAARHLTKALENRELPADERRTSTKSLQKALTKVAQLYIDVNPSGADLRIDGEPITVTRDAAWLLDAGPHTIVARKEGYLDATQDVTATAGRELRTALTLSHELNQEIVKPAAATTKDAPKPPLPAAPDPSNAPPVRFFIAEGIIGLGAVGAGTYFAAKPDTEKNDRTVGATLIGCGAFVLVGTFVLWLATKPSALPSSSAQAVSVDIPRLRVTF